MKQYIQISLDAVKRKLNPNKRQNCFEIFGYDFILDADFNSWLIEVNTNPCLEESSSILKMLLPRMLNDALKLTVDRVFKPQSCSAVIEQPYPVTGHGNQANMWEWLTNLQDKKPDPLIAQTCESAFKHSERM